MKKLKFKNIQSSRTKIGCGLCGGNIKIGLYKKHLFICCPACMFFEILDLEDLKNYEEVLKYGSNNY